MLATGWAALSALVEPPAALVEPPAAPVEHPAAPSAPETLTASQM